MSRKWREKQRQSNPFAAPPKVSGKFVAIPSPPPQLTQLAESFTPRKPTRFREAVDE